VSLSEDPVASATGEGAEVVDGSSNRLLLLCEHAGNCIPTGWGDLGLERAFLDTHFGWDPGAASLTRSIARRLSAPAVLAKYSRIFYDINRPPENPFCTRTDLCGIPVPGNLLLDDRERLLRRSITHEPFTRGIAARLATRPALIDIHSFTPVMNGCQRETEIGILWRSESQIGEGMLNALRRHGRFRVGDNDPYDMRSEPEGIVQRIAIPLGLPFVAIEVRSDVLTNERQLADVGECLSMALAQTLSLNVSERTER
jgi:predicted N-formylglutamate amidohydrolase